jgi:DNA mismatch endonuclease (patch repair protein)
MAGYRLNWRTAAGRVDIAYPGRHVAVFVHGCFWHRCPSCALPLPKSNTDFWARKFERNVERDSRVESELTSLGWTVVTVWECELKHDTAAVVARIARSMS